MEARLFGYGVSLTPSHCGGGWSDGYYVPVTHSWMLGFYWVAPWCPIEGEDMMMLPKKWWCSRCFYFGDSPVPKSLRRTVYDWLRSV